MGSGGPEGRRLVMQPQPCEPSEEGGTETLLRTGTSKMSWEEETCGIVDVIYLCYSASQKWVRKREDRGLQGISRMGRDATTVYCGAEDKGSRQD